MHADELYPVSGHSPNLLLTPPNTPHNRTRHPIHAHPPVVWPSRWRAASRSWGCPSPPASTRARSRARTWLCAERYCTWWSCGACTRHARRRRWTPSARRRGRVRRRRSGKRLRGSDEGAEGGAGGPCGGSCGAAAAGSFPC